MNLIGLDKRSTTVCRMNATAYWKRNRWGSASTLQLMWQTGCERTCLPQRLLYICLQNSTIITRGTCVKRSVDFVTMRHNHGDDTLSSQWQKPRVEKYSCSITSNYCLPLRHRPYIKVCGEQLVSGWFKAWWQSVGLPVCVSVCGGEGRAQKLLDLRLKQASEKQPWCCRSSLIRHSSDYCFQRAERHAGRFGRKQNGSFPRGSSVPNITFVWLRSRKHRAGNKSRRIYKAPLVNHTF